MRLKAKTLPSAHLHEAVSQPRPPAAHPCATMALVRSSVRPLAWWTRRVAGQLLLSIPLAGLSAGRLRTKGIIFGEFKYLGV